MCQHYLLQSTFQHMKIDLKVRLKVNNALYITEEILEKGKHSQKNYFTF